MLFGHRLNKYYIKNIIPYLIGIIFLIIVDYVQVLLPEQVARITEGVRQNTLTIEILKNIVLTILVYGFIMAFSRLIWRICLIGSARKIEVDLKNEMFAHSQKLSQEYYSKQKVGALMSLFTADVDTIRMSLGFGIVMMVDAFFLSLLSLYKMFRINWILTIAALVPMLIIGIGGIWFSASFEKSYLKRQEAQEKLSDFTQENFSGISVIKAYVKQRREFFEFCKHNKSVYNASINFIRKIALLETLIETLIALSIVAIFALGGYLASGDNPVLNGTDIVMFYQLFFMLIWPMIALAQIINNISQGKASLKRISEFLDEKVTVTDAADTITPDEVKGSIDFVNLTFRYPGNEAIALDNINFSIKDGETIGIIGRTGCGKSTLVELLLRTYNVDGNSLFIGGYDIMKLPLRTTRQNIGYVPQNNFLFSDTIHNNIAFGLENNLEDRALVEEVAKLAVIDKNIKEFKDGYDTIVGERGTTLSGGQKQRISIARALIRTPNILIFDDSVSAVDTATEVGILKNLRKVRKGKTTLIIGHRISTMKSMDRVILVDDSKIVAIGTHRELEKSCPLYQQMIKAQELEG